MKKTFRNILSVGVMALAGIALISCNSNKKEAQDTVVEETVEDDAAMPSDTIAEKYNAAFFTDSASNYKETPSGLRYAVVTEGTGVAPKASDNVMVHYTGRLLDGTVFDSSVVRGEPATFPLGGVIKGWTEGLQLMKEGGTTVFYIPSDLAYGSNGTPDGSIPPNAPLIFEVQLIKVNP